MVVLFVASTFKHIKAFHIPYITMLCNQGHIVDAAANDVHIDVPQTNKNYNLPINRSPFSYSNLSAISALRKLIRINKYDLIHCHTAMGSVVTRLACLFLKNRPKVIYTAHGFHFFKGGPLKNWLLYFPMEWILSFCTDSLIVLNEEDYVIAKKWFHIKALVKIDGIGLDVKKIESVDLGKNEIRKKNNFSEEDFLILYIAEFISRKNHEWFISKAVEFLSSNPEIKILFAGRGELREKLEGIIHEKGLTKQVVFLGFRNDIGEVIKMSDIGISLSKQEGLPMNIIELMYSGLPIVATKIRGHIDLIQSGHNGFLFDLKDEKKFFESIQLLKNNLELRNNFSANAQVIAKKYVLSHTISQMQIIYSNILNTKK